MGITAAGAALAKLGLDRFEVETVRQGGSGGGPNRFKDLADVQNLTPFNDGDLWAFDSNKGVFLNRSKAILTIADNPHDNVQHSPSFAFDAMGGYHGDLDHDFGVGNPGAVHLHSVSAQLSPVTQTDPNPTDTNITSTAFANLATTGSFLFSQPITPLRFYFCFIEARVDTLGVQGRFRVVADIGGGLTQMRGITPSVEATERVLITFLGQTPLGLASSFTVRVQGRVSVQVAGAGTLIFGKTAIIAWPIQTGGAVQ